MSASRLWAPAVPGGEASADYIGRLKGYEVGSFGASRYKAVVAFDDDKRGKYNLKRSCKDGCFFTAPFECGEKILSLQWLAYPCRYFS
jgi:hypothetical protein